jgi:hypothetical protein
VVIAIFAVIVLGIAVVVGVVVAGGGGDDEQSGGGGGDEEIQLVSVAAPGPNPFTPPAAPAEPPATTLSPPQPPYGGTGDNTLCDRAGIIAYLADPANAAQMRAWIDVVGITEAEITTYINDLVPTTLAEDIRITNHTFENGRAVGFQAVLESGTAVLVDVYGKPVVRCRCGNPLLAPKQVSNPVYVGRKWAGFSPSTVVVVNVNTNVQVFPPGGVGTIPTSTPSTTTTRPSTTTTATTAPSGGGEARAAAIMKEKLEACIANAPEEDFGFITREEFDAIIAQLQYSAVPGTAPNVYTVTVSAEAAGGTVATWSVNTATEAVTAADPIAAELDPYCPNFA